MKNFISDNTGILIRIDDIAENMNWDLMDKCEVLFDKYNIKPVLGVIPNNQDQELMSYPRKGNFWEKVRQWKKKGWEISMHGYTHLYSQTTNKKDYFGYGGNSEFFGQKFEIQKDKIEKGLQKFSNEKIKIRSFYAPNHTYDANTLKALKECKINNIIDGYGLMPYSNKGLYFFPQLFHKVILLPFGVQCTQIHLNYWKEIEFNNFENFIRKNKKKIISFDDAILKINDSMFYKLINFLFEKLLKLIRIFK